MATRPLIRKDKLAELLPLSVFLLTLPCQKRNVLESKRTVSARAKELWTEPFRMDPTMEIMSHRLVMRTKVVNTFLPYVNCSSDRLPNLVAALQRARIRIQHL